MRVAGFTFIRNAEIYDYPIVEAINSILPLCEKVFVALGNSDDNTMALVASISEKVVIVPTLWDDALREGGRVLAQETDKAFDALLSQGPFDWAVYIQGDEVMHEEDHARIRAAMLRYNEDSSIEGLLFNYIHFFGSYDYQGASPRWYRREVRIIRADQGIRSFRDAQGFRRQPGDRKLRVAATGATMHHYGWVKHPDFQKQKARNFNKYWHNDAAMEQKTLEADQFDYAGVDALALFQGTHPAVMQPRIAARNWAFSRDLSRNRLSIKNRVKLFIEKLTGWRPGEFKNFKT